jgi:hypothetical protein
MPKLTGNRFSLSTVSYILLTTLNIISAVFILISLHNSSYLPNGLFLAGVVWEAGTVLIKRCSVEGRFDLDGTQ